MAVMVTQSDQPGRSQDGAVRSARRQRDAAFLRIRSVTKTVTVASLAGVAGLTIYFSQARPGHTTPPVASTVNPNGTTPTPTGGSTAPNGDAGAGSATGGVPSSGSTSSPGSSGAASDGGSNGFGTPAAAPQPSQQPAPVTSGAS